ncbi:MAG: response regulator [Thaumarchaeota archaeon]|nr:response regulator [Nitrososphaerota archaeon]
MKILIIDDNESLAIMFSRMLELGGHKTIASNDGRNGLALIQKEKFDVIVLDLSMPEFSGYDILDALEKDDMMKDKKIIVLTATAITQEQIDRLKKQGVKDVLKKPIRPDVINEALKNIAGQ